MRLIILVAVGIAEISLAVANLYGIEWAWNILKAWSIALVIVVLVTIKHLTKSKEAPPKHIAVIASIIDLFVAVLLAASGKIAWAVFWMFMALLAHLKRQWAKTNIEKEEMADPEPDDGEKRDDGQETR